VCASFASGCAPETTDGGVIMGAISGIPFLNFINCLCCAGIIFGGFMAVFFYNKDLKPGDPPLMSSDALQLGALAGVFGAITGDILTVILHFALGNIVAGTTGGMIMSMYDRLGILDKMPPEALEQMQADGRTRSIGVSNFQPPHLQRLLDETDISSSQNSDILTFKVTDSGTATKLSATSAALAVAQAPGKSYNPLFLYGGVGLGKTHLLHAIGQYVAQHRKGARVAYLSSERFTNEYIDAIQSNQFARFRRKYRQTDVLLLDVSGLDGRVRATAWFNRGKLP